MSIKALHGENPPNDHGSHGQKFKLYKTIAGHLLPYGDLAKLGISGLVEAQEAHLSNLINTCQLQINIALAVDSNEEIAIRGETLIGYLDTIVSHLKVAKTLNDEIVSQVCEVRS